MIPLSSVVHEGRDFYKDDIARGVFGTVVLRALHQAVEMMVPLVYTLWFPQTLLLTKDDRDRTCNDRRVREIPVLRREAVRVIL